MDTDKKGTYHSPEVRTMEVKTEDVICSSGPSGNWFEEEEPM